MSRAAALRPVQRLAAYGVVRRGREGDVVLVRSGPRSDVAGTWYLPGGGLRHGEHPEEAVVREVEEETGLRVASPRLLRVDDDVLALPHRGVAVHTTRFTYAVDDVGGALRAEAAGTTDEVVAVRAGEAAGLPLMPFVARVLDLPVPPPPTPRPPAEPEPLLDGPAAGGASEQEDGAAVVRQRLAAYAVVLHGGSALLTRLAPSTPSPGRWTLPGGGVDHGESVADAVVREVEEETGAAVTPAGVLLVDSTRFTGRSPRGVLEDFHAVRVVHRADLAGRAAEPVVRDVGGTTDAAAWVPLDEALAGGLPLAPVARRALLAVRA